MNRFAYAEANPWTLVDPSGHGAHNLDRGIGEAGAYLAQDLEEARAYAALAKLTKQGVYRAHAARAAHTYVAHARQIEATGNPLLIGAAIFAPVLVAVGWEAALPVAAMVESATASAAASAADTLITALTVGRVAGPAAACAAVNCVQKAQTAAGATCEFLGPCAPGSGPATFGGAPGTVRGGTAADRLIGGADDAASTVWRGDGRPPDEIFANGFKPNGSDMGLLDHANGSPTSGYVATSTDPGVASGFGPYLYKVTGAPNGVDVNATLGKLSPYPGEMEVAFPGGIDACFVEGCYSPSGQWVGNPGYGH